MGSLQGNQDRKPTKFQRFSSRCGPHGLRPLENPQCDRGSATGVSRMGGYFGRVTKPEQEPTGPAPAVAAAAAVAVVVPKRNQLSLGSQKLSALYRTIGKCDCDR